MNPLTTISGVAITAPSKFVIGTQDISAPGAGRTMDATMHKKTVSRKVRLDLSWNVLSHSQYSQLLNATSSEYFSVKYLGANGSFVTGTFYRGDIKAEWYGHGTNVWKDVSFPLIER